MTVKPSCAACLPSLCLKKRKMKKYQYLESTTIYLSNARQNKKSLFSQVRHARSENRARELTACFANSFLAEIFPSRSELNEQRDDYLRRHIKHARQCLTTFPNNSTFVKNTPPRVVFFTFF